MSTATAISLDVVRGVYPGSRGLGVRASPIIVSCYRVGIAGTPGDITTVGGWFEIAVLVLPWLCETLLQENASAAADTRSQAENPPLCESFFGHEQTKGGVISPSTFI